jgi:predicted nucleotidyltransferase
MEGQRMAARIDIPCQLIYEFCRRNRIRRLGLFGSILRDDFGPDSDANVLVEFELDASVGLITLAGMELELGQGNNLLWLMRVLFLRGALGYTVRFCHHGKIQDYSPEEKEEGCGASGPAGGSRRG